MPVRLMPFILYSLFIDEFWYSRCSIANQIISYRIFSAGREQRTLWQQPTLQSREVQNTMDLPPLIRVFFDMGLHRRLCYNNLLILRAILSRANLPTVMAFSKDHPLWGARLYQFISLIISRKNHLHCMILPECTTELVRMDQCTRFHQQPRHRPPLYHQWPLPWH